MDNVHFLPAPYSRIRLNTEAHLLVSMDILPADRRENIVAWAFAKIDLRAFVVASAIIAAAFLLMLTLGLVVKGAAPGVPVGPHLARLGVFFPGYTVTFGGAFVGAAYASVLGAALGFVLATIWNVTHSLVLALIRVQANLAAYTID